MRRLLAALVVVLSGCGANAVLPGAGAVSRGPSATSPSAGVLAPTQLDAIDLGRGFVAFPDAASAWVAAHPKDSRTPAIRARIAGQPTALWLTGPESLGNLRTYSALATKRNGTMVLSVWNIPLRWDGLSTPSTVTLAEYRSWLTGVARTIADTRAVIVLEPDALWFYDRLPTAADRSVRLTALRYAISTLHRLAPRARVYLDAGTASGSVTPTRMAQLLVSAGLASAAGFAVNVSSYAPTARITAYAQQIRAALTHRGVADPRYVVDTGRNGATTWDNNWCNPPQQRLGAVPALVNDTRGADLRLWVKAPGTSDGDCGPAGGGKGSTGGQFLPAVAYRMITG